MRFASTLMGSLLSAALLVSPVVAAPISVTVLTEPAAVDVYLMNSAAGGRGMFLGNSSGPLLLEERFLEGRGSIDLRLEKDGFYPLDHNFKTLALRDGETIPKDGALRLAPKTSGGWSGSRLLLGLIPASVLAFFAFRRGRFMALAEAPVGGVDDRPRTLDPLVGRVICGFEVQRVMARGGMGVLYLAESKATKGEQAAVKVVDLTGVDDAMKQRFFRELTMASKLHHPGIVRTWDYEVLEERYLAIVMEWLPGADLSERMKDRILTPGESMIVLKPIFEALGYLHDKHIIHRDIKPANIFVLPDGQCKLIDFGLARDELRSGLTATGVFMGTPQYVAPEQIVGKEVHPPVDQYALGLVIYHLVTGLSAFPGTDAMQVLTAQMTVMPPAIHEVDYTIPLAFSQGISRMIEKDPAKRFPSVMDAYAYLIGTL